jgi:hypothetical protein
MLNIGISWEWLRRKYPKLIEEKFGRWCDILFWPIDEFPVHVIINVLTFRRGRMWISWAFENYS